jgi:hypothetical protein
MNGRVVASGVLILALVVSACAPGNPTAEPSTFVPSVPPSDASPTTVAPSPTVSTAPTPTPTLTPEVATAAFGDWTRIELQDPAPKRIGGFPAALVVFKGRLLAIGSDVYSCCAGGDLDKSRGLIWSTRDGTSWRLHDPVEGLQPAFIADVVTDGARLVAVGTYGVPVAGEEQTPIPATWASTDAVTWVRSPGEAPSLIAVGSRGFIGVMTDREAGTARFVRSDDGLTWTSTSNSLQVDVRQLAVDAAGHGVALGVVPGEMGPDGEPYDDTVLIRSPDGETWDSPEPFVAAAFAPFGTASLIGDASGFVASLMDWVTGEDQLWRITTDGATRLPLVAAPNEESWNLIATGDVLLLNRHERNQRVVWISLDGGTTWGRVASGPALDRTIEELAGGAVVGDRLVVVGSRHGNEPFHVLPVAWIADR